MTKDELLLRIHDITDFLEYEAVPRSLEYETAMQELDGLWAEFQKMEYGVSISRQTGVFSG